MLDTWVNLFPLAIGDDGKTNWKPLRENYMGMLIENIISVDWALLESEALLIYTHSVVLPEAAKNNWKLAFDLCEMWIYRVHVQVVLIIMSV